MKPPTASIDAGTLCVHANPPPRQSDTLLAIAADSGVPDPHRQVTLPDISSLHARSRATNSSRLRSRAVDRGATRTTAGGLELAGSAERRVSSRRDRSPQRRKGHLARRRFPRRQGGRRGGYRPHCGTEGARDRLLPAARHVRGRRGDAAVRNVQSSSPIRRPRLAETRFGRHRRPSIVSTGRLRHASGRRVDCRRAIGRRLEGTRGRRSRERVGAGANARVPVQLSRAGRRRVDHVRRSIQAGQTGR